MVTKGFVKEILNPYRVKVVMPVFSRDNLTSTTASVCTLSNCMPNLKVGDVVYIAFEDGGYGKPVVIGALLKSDQAESSKCSLMLESLDVAVDTHLSNDTSIGSISYQEIEALKDIKSNIQLQINDLQKEIDILKAKVEGG